MSEHEEEERLLSSSEDAASGEDDDTIPSAVRIRKLAKEGKTDELRLIIAALQSKLQTAEAELKLQQQTAGIATRDYNEVTERNQQLQDQVDSLTAQLLDSQLELERMLEQLQQQEDLTKTERQRAEAQIQEVAAQVAKVKELQEQVEVLSGLFDEVAGSVGKASNKMEQYQRQKTGNRQPQQGSGAGSSGAGSGGAGGGAHAGGAKGQQNQPGYAPRRSAEHFAFLRTKQMCARCFGQAHDFKTCTAPIRPANEVPPGFPGSSG